MSKYSGEHAQTSGAAGGFLRSALNFIAMIVLVFVMAWAMRTFIFGAYEIPSGSMENTIMVDDRVFAEKISYYIDDPQQGDIVTFDDPEIHGRTLIKRIIAVGGQTVDLIDGVVYVDGQPLDEPYTEGKPSYPLVPAYGVDITYPYTVPADHIWVMGDNRTKSSDSRYFGAVPASSVSGKAVFTYWPISSIGILE
ncbi:MAG: signal peptidase I [Eggerthellaceae bacterium]|nr:signal peptidase I [Eggerthellaceae bacterium]